VLPILTGIISFELSAAGNFVPDCNPVIDGCTTISAAGRHGAAYYVFKAGMLPAALCQLWFWPRYRTWLLGGGLTDSFGLRAMAVLGSLAAVFLIAYTVALGSPGDIYRLMRRFGVMLYFGFSFLAQVLLLNRLVDAQRTGAPVIPLLLTTMMLGVVVAMFAMALYAIPLGQLIPDPDDIGINIIEWNFALLLSLWYLLPWWSWRRHPAVS
jgi:hypothetical protein